MASLLLLTSYFILEIQMTDLLHKYELVSRRGAETQRRERKEKKSNDKAQFSFSSLPWRPSLLYERLRQRDAARMQFVKKNNFDKALLNLGMNVSA
jgi:hypothetical protein